MGFPIIRPRRLREKPAIRSLVQEHRLLVDDLIQPFFVTHGSQVRNPVTTMPGIFQLSIDELLKEAKEVADLGIPAILLFGIPKKKDERASEAYAQDGIIQQATSELKEKIPQLMVITDVCLCEYMSHGHCGVVHPPLNVRGGTGGRYIDNDASLELLARTALSHAQAGADIVAPSDMMDGRVRAIREALDKNNCVATPILSYAVKYASAYYGPFREAAESAPQFGDRKSYQMDPANVREGLREALFDEQEGADMLMVKPAGPCLDVIAAVRAQTKLPLVAYQVSGEYSLIKAAGEKKWIDAKAVLLESLLGIKRAGADLIVSYAAKEFALTR